jgi:hypothetical protein
MNRRNLPVTAGKEYETRLEYPGIDISSNNLKERKDV